MKHLHLALMVAGIASGCSLAQARQAAPPATSALVNPSFDEQGGSMAGWAVRGEEFGRAEAVREPVASAPGALLMVAGGRGSSGNNSLMVYQVLDPAPYRGRRVRFSARIRTDGGAVNMTLFTPEGLANDFFTDLKSGKFVERSGTFNVPKNASFLSFGLQIMGMSGARAYVDDVVISAEGGQAGALPPLTLPPLGPQRSTGSAPGSVSAGANAGSSGDSVQIRIDAGKPGAAVNPLVFGMHLEWSDAGNGLMDRSGNMRAEVVDALRAVSIPLFRFPGGIHADYYDWRKGAEPRNRRPPVTNIFNNRSEPQPFGSPEFVELVKATRAEMLITANYGTGTAEDAGAWARYFKDAGVPAQYWEVGNEIYLADPAKEQPNGKRIAKAGDQYARDFPQFRAAILAATPGVKVGLIGHVDDGAFPIAPAARRDWTDRMLATFKGKADFMSVHNAYAPVVINDSIKFTDARARLNVYRTMYAAPQQTARNLADMAAELDRHEATRGLPLAITEWGPLFGYSGKRDVTAEYADQSRTMAAAVYVAAMLDWMLGEPRLLLATYTNPIHEFYGSLLTDTDHQLVKTPSYYVFSMYRSRFESRLVPATVETPRFSSNTIGLVNAQSNVPEVSARASVSANGRRLTAMLVNRSIDRSMNTRITVDGFPVGRVDCQVLAADAPSAINGPALSKSTSTGRTIAPAPVDCSGGDQIAVSIPPSAVVSLVAERR